MGKSPKVAGVKNVEWYTALLNQSQEGFQTLASAHALRLPRTLVQIFWVHSRDSEDSGGVGRGLGVQKLIQNWSIVQREWSIEVKYEASSLE